MTVFRQTMGIKTYRYEASKHDWSDTDTEWTQLEDYTKSHFHNTVIGPYHIYFSANPVQFRNMLNALRIGSSAFSIVISSHNYLPIEVD